MATNEAQGKSDSTLPKESLSTRIAYALPHYRILWEDEFLEAANRYTRKILGLPLFACLYWVETTGSQDRMPLPLRLNNYQSWWKTHGSPQFLKPQRLLLEAEAQRAFTNLQKDSTKGHSGLILSATHSTSSIWVSSCELQQRHLKLEAFLSYV